MRCRAAVSTSVREVEVEAQRTALRGNFEAASVSEECRMYYGRRGGGDAYLVTEADVPAEEETGGEMMVAAFEAALVGVDQNAEALCEMAMPTTRSSSSWRRCRSRLRTAPCRPATRSSCGSATADGAQLTPRAPCPHGQVVD